MANSNAIQNSTATLNAANGLAFAGEIGTFNLGGLAGSGNLVLTDANSADVTVIVGGNGQSTQFSGIIGDTDRSGALTKIGSGMLTLSGSDSYGGGTTISAGTLQLGNGALNGSVAGNISDSGMLAFNNANARLTAASSAATAP